MTMYFEEYLRLADDGCPHTPEHVACRQTHIWVSVDRTTGKWHESPAVVYPVFYPDTPPPVYVELPVLGYTNFPQRKTSG